MKLNQVKGIVGEIATKAKHAAKNVAKNVQKHTETPEKLTKSMDAMDASGRALVLRSRKAAAKTGTKTVSNTAAETAKKTPEGKLLDLVTGTKANKSAQESAELMNADAAYKAAIGPQANKSAADSASTFIIEGNTEKGAKLEKALTEAERKAEYLKNNPEFADKLSKQQDVAKAALAQERTELMNADAAYKAAIGPQANKSAADSASTFIIEGNTEKGAKLEKALTETERKAEYLKNNPEFADKLAQKQQDAANAAKIEATKARLQQKYAK